MAGASFWKKAALPLVIFPLLLLSARVGAIPYTDPVGDLIDGNGNPVVAEAFIDIVSVDMKRSSVGGIIVEIIVNASLPTKVDPSLWFEWNIYFDVDSNVNTGSRSSTLYNDLGVEYVMKLSLRGSTRYLAELYRMETSSNFTLVGRPHADVVENKITFAVEKFDIQIPAKFSWMAATRKYSENPAGGAGLLIALDKAPNRLHYAASLEQMQVDTTASAQTTAPQTSLTGFLNTQHLQQIGGAAATAGSIVFGWFFKTRKRRLISGYLSKIDSTAKDQSIDADERKKRLGKIREEVLDLMKRGKIEESQFSMLDTQLRENMKEIT